MGRVGKRRRNALRKSEKGKTLGHAQDAAGGQQQLCSTGVERRRSPPTAIVKVGSEL